MLQVNSRAHALSRFRSSTSIKFNYRGERCKFKHPADKKEGDEKIPFCNDFRQVRQSGLIYNNSVLGLMIDNSGHMQVQGVHLCACTKDPGTRISANR